MSKTNRSRFLKIVALILPLLFIFIFSQEFLFDRRSYDSDRLEKFYLEEKDSLDVVFIGASEVTQGYNPGYAYDKYGFTSYKYSIDANQGSLYLSQLKEVLNHQNPEILFVDLSGFLIDDDEQFFNNIILLNYARGIPFSENKVRTIMQYPDEEKLPYFFPLIMHHGNASVAYDRLSEVYRRLTREEQPALLKGALTYTHISANSEDVGKPFDPLTYGLTDNVKATLVEFLDYCKANDLNIVFTNFPRHIADERNHNLLFLFDQTKSIIEEYGYPVWNLQEEMDAIGIDKKHDFVDSPHLNIYGQVKLTDYISSHIIDQYGLTPRTQSEQNRLEWEICAANNREFINLAVYAMETGRDLALYETSQEWLFRLTVPESHKIM